MKKIIALTIVSLTGFSFSHAEVDWAKYRATEDKVIAACNVNPISETCISECHRIGFTKPIESDDHDSITNHECVAALVKEKYSNFQSTDKIIKLHRVNHSLFKLAGSGYKVKLVGTPDGYNGYILDSKGRTTVLDMCGTCITDDYLSGPYKKAQLRRFDETFILFLDGIPK